MTRKENLQVLLPGPERENIVSVLLPYLMSGHMDEQTKSIHGDGVHVVQSLPHYICLVYRCINYVDIAVPIVLYLAWVKTTYIPYLMVLKADATMIILC